MLGKTTLGQSVLGSDRALVSQDLEGIFQAFWKICSTVYIKNEIFSTLSAQFDPLIVYVSTDYVKNNILSSLFAPLRTSTVFARIASSTFYVKNVAKTKVDKPKCTTRSIQ